MRPENWQSLLAEYIERHRALPFVWGRHDCATFARNWIALARPDLTDFAAWDHVPRDDDASGRAVTEQQPLIERVDAWGALARTAPAFAQRGDLLVLAVGGHTQLAIHAGMVAVAPGPEQLAAAPDPHLALAAWKV